MGMKSPNIAAFMLPLLLILFTLSSQLKVVESTGRKLAWGFSGTPIVYTPPSRSCGTSPAVFTSKWRRPRPCRLPPGSYIPASDQSP
ncbi:hypothetical protein AtNW77_Chr1g0065841 [Arabidopsis thaliana]|uniref:Secreted transmembrane peptide 6 n=3 Tax=Arabidopsis TaxID=3701 RepID=STMP6_ARATH|nr:uncharacterized protein AT1G65500 [Arabidopsis thaliana]O04468.1 RecName: Full=Secreted transmembrane peptide 6; AltName: Full=Phytocytokine STMP6; AltName: Full=Precursor of secreted transmembrane peptide 6; Flags: Precursor [Arabidopsis thaliana]KAG7650658.1 hypothetical protein ISN45_At01g055950 [Arabidopsis thaliana x Arabidopsis arenosa]AAB60905.1 F5I14.4 gene product [Arabidopsis thaliana]AEE34390.1 transmembrane protein [Arabidopsis thaliana]OAP19458.1 hypothetical protein AXX17_AT1G|eukprot:NP_564855.1 transmembrane protein [Arabidopsis thaliana]